MMKTFTKKQKRWKTYTTVLMLSVFISIFANAISSVLEFIESIMNTISVLFNEAAPSEYTDILSWGFIGKIALFIAYGGFIWGTTKLKNLLPEDNKSWKKIRTAFILLLVGAFISWVLHFFPIINILGLFVFWLLSVIAFCKQKKAFGNLYNSKRYSHGASQGFNLLKNVASCNLALHTWIPLIIILLLLIVGSSSISAISSSGSLNDLEKSLFGSYAGLAVVGIFSGVVFSMIALYIFIANIIGWIRVKCGNLIEEETQSSEYISNKSKEDDIKTPSITNNNEEPIKVNTNKGGKKLLVGSISFVIIVFLGFFMLGSKQVEFETKLPVWQKFIIVEKSDVNLRQSPDVNSQKLMEEEGAMDSYLIWSDEPKGADSGERKPYRLDDNSVCPVLAETGDWYEILVQIGDKYNLSTKKAYIMKKFCKEVKAIPIKNSRFYKIPDGKFKNKYLEYDYGGVYAEPSSLTMGWEIDGGYIFPEAFKHPFENNGSSERFVFNILTEDRLEQWFGKITEETVGAYHLYYNFAEAGLQWYYIDPYDYPGEMSK